MRILIEISTKDRDTILGRCLASLLLQDFREWDLLIINDGNVPVGRNKTTEFLRDLIVNNGHSVTVIPGRHVSQAHNHNIPLYDSRFVNYKYIYRADDDILADKKAIANLYETITKYDAAAVGGLWFESEWKDEIFHDRGEMSEIMKSKEVWGDVGAANSNWQQRMYHPTDTPYDVEHIYSNCIYNAERMRLAGGWPEVYSRGVAHGEETDGTYRLFLNGGLLLVDPRATGQHLKESGGIRSSKDVGEKQYMDSLKWQDRLPELKKISFRPSVAIWCQHSFGFGGAQRVFYELISMLQFTTGLDVYPIFSGQYFTPKECEMAFGFTYTEREPKKEYDVCIVMGHEPFKPVKAKKYILHVFFPDEARETFDDIALILTHSKYTAEYIEKEWGYESDVVSYYVKRISGHRQKENIILVVSRYDPFKAPLLMMEWFCQIREDLPGWTMHVIGGTTGGVYPGYEDQIRKFAGENGIALHENVPSEEVEDLYKRAKIAWCAKGINADGLPKEAEHFGLVPIEAWQAGCVPVAFDLAGHRETVCEPLRWKTQDDLRRITLALVKQMDKDFSGMRSVVDLFMLGQAWNVEGLGAIYPCHHSFYDPVRYIRSIENYIRRVNGMALELRKVDRISVKNRAIRVAAIADSPHITTGFGTVVNEIYKRIVAQKDMSLSVFGLMDYDFPKREDFERDKYDFFPAYPDDPQGQRTLPQFIRWAQPDVIFMMYDPGNLNGQILTLHSVGIDKPVIAYFPIEGEPITKATYQVVEKVDVPVVYCQCEVDAIKRVLPNAKVYWKSHGIDHAPFAPLHPEKRAKIRNLIGWDGKFVIYNIGTNKRVKQQPYLIEAMRILLSRGYDDIYMYLHTKQFNQHIMQGWTLDWIADYWSDVSGLPISDHILYPMEFADQWKGIPYGGWDDLDIWRITQPPTSQLRGAIFNNLDYVTRLGLADMYVDVSSAEGWGLPTLEAVACGIPTISVNDGMVRTEVHSKYCQMIDPVHWDTWHSSARLVLVDPEDVADAIVTLRESPDLMKKYSSYWQKIREDLPWTPTCEFFVDKIREEYMRVSR